MLRSLLLIVLIGLATTNAPLRAQEPSATEDTVATAPVMIDGVELFRVRGVSSFPADARARGIQDRIAAVAADRTISVDSVHLAESPGAIRILTGDRLIMGVVEADAAIEQVTLAALASAHRLRIQQAITDYRAARTGNALRGAAINTLLGTLLAAGMVWLLFVVWRPLDRLVKRRLESHVHSVEIQSFRVMRAEHIWAALHAGLLAIRTVVLLALVLVYLGWELSLWPWTRGLSQNLVGFALGPLNVIGQGIVANIPRLVFLVVLFFVIRVVLRLVRLFLEAVEQGTVTLARFDREWAQPTYKLIRIAIIAFGLVVAYPYIPGSQTEAFKGVSLFIGIVFSLGSSTAISNMIAGYMMTYRRAFKVGDRVKIGDTIGEVIETRLQVTHLRSPKNEEIVIPNAQILSGEVMNFSSIGREQGLILHTEVGIGYETPWRQVEAMLLEAADRTPGLAAEPKAFILLKKLGDFAVTYELNVYLREVKKVIPTYTELHRHILDVFNEYGVQIMTPAYEGDPEQPKVVAPKDWYTAPAARPADVGTARRG